MTTSTSATNRTTLSSAIHRLLQEQATYLPDVVAPLNALSWTENGHLSVPGMGTTQVNAWAKEQLSHLLGVRFDRWFQRASPTEQAEEMSRRLRRGTRKVRLRFTRGSDRPILRAVVSPSFAPLDDSLVLSAVGDALASTDPTIHRIELTQRLTCVVINIGEPQHVGSGIGEVSGTLTIANSNVGWSELSVQLSLLRLVCSNGMRAPIHEAQILGIRHRNIDFATVRAQLLAGVRAVPANLRQANRVIEASTAWPVINVEAEARALLRERGMIQRHHSSVMAAFRREPHETVFGVAQAIALHAQQVIPEERVALEGLAGGYVLRSTP